MVTARHVLVVDGANVVGSRPDGWWRDRGGAAARLHVALVAALPSLRDAGHAEVLLVLEGAARAGVAEGEAHGVRTRHAPGSGDDALVAAVGELRREATGAPEVTVVTADRALRVRVAALGARTVGPRWLRDRMTDDATPQS